LGHALLAPLAFALLGCGDDTTAPDPEIAQLAVVVSPRTAVTGEPLGVAPVVELRSADGRPIETAGVVIDVTASRGALGGSTSATTDERGRAVFSGLSIAAEPGSVRLEFSCCELPAAVTTLTLSTGSGLIALSPTTVTGKVNSSVFGLSVRALDEQLRPIPGVTVRFSFEGGRLPETSVATATDGVARLPAFAMSPVIGTEVLTATDAASGEAVTFELVSTPDPKAVLVGGGFDPVMVVGTTVTLPAMVVTNGLPIEGLAVSYRVLSGGGVLSTETAMTDATGTSEPVTLTLAERGATTVEIEAAGYSAEPASITVRGVIPPVAFAYPDPCPEFATCPAFDFSFDGWEWLTIALEVRDAVGPLGYFPVDFTTSGDAGWLGYTMGPWDVDLSNGGTVLTGENGSFAFWWMLSHGGTHTITLSGPLIDDPLTYRATP
jgi:hypothetical protein